MFDVSFSELLVIAVVALLVIGPEKLPKVARTVGAFTGRMQRYMAQIKEEVNREMHFEELQKLQQEIKQSVEKAQSSINQQATDLQNAVADTAQITDSPGPNPKPNPRKPRAAAPKRTKAPAKPSE
jgi:sec-independent protein translocase protein TatB